MSGGWRRHTRWLLVLGDCLAAGLFVYIGQRDHDLVDPVNPLWGVLQSTLMFVAPWVAVGAWLGGFPTALAGASRRPDLGFLSRSLNVWLVTALLGLLLRSWLLGRAVIPTVFVVATVGFGGLFLVGWRALFAAAYWITSRRRPAEPGVAH